MSCLQWMGLSTTVLTDVMTNALTLLHAGFVNFLFLDIQFMMGHRSGLPEETTMDILWSLLWSISSSLSVR